MHCYALVVDFWTKTFDILIWRYCSTACLSKYYFKKKYLQI